MKLKLLALCALSGSLLIGCGSDTTTANDSGAGVGQNSSEFTGTVIQNDGNTIKVSNGKEVKTYTIGTGTTVVSDSSGGNSLGNVQTGMTITVQADGSMATMVTYDTEVEGIVESIVPGDSPDTGVLVVMGQTVVVDDKTMLDGMYTTLSDIAVGDDIEVNGETMMNGDILATFIEPHNSSLGYEIEGMIASTNAIDSALPTNFMIGECEINIVAETTYASDTVVEDIVTGAEVEVTVAMDPNTASACPVNALEIELVKAADTIAIVDPIPGTGGTTPTPALEIVSIEGMATAAPDATTNMFEVTDMNGVATNAMLTDTTTYTNGMMADIMANTPVVVTGTLDANNVLVATEVVINAVTVPEMKMMDVEGVVIDTPVNGSFMIGDYSIVTSDFTMYADGTADAIIAGTKLVVKGYEDPAATMTINAEVIEFIHVDVTGLADAAVVDNMFNVIAMVDGQAVTTMVMITDTTIYPRENTSAADIMADTEVTVIGLYDVAGNLVAHEIEIQLPMVAPIKPMPTPVMLNGILEDVVLQDGIIVIMGVDVMVISDPAMGTVTMITGMQVTPPPAQVAAFDPNAPAIALADLMPGVYISVMGSIDADGIITAETIAVEPPPMGMAMSMVTGITMVKDGKFIVAEVEIDLSALPVDPAATTPFDPMMYDGKKVTVTGEYVGSMLVASSLVEVMPPVAGM